jgi:hypothetical protein
MVVKMIRMSKAGILGIVSLLFLTINVSAQVNPADLKNKTPEQRAQYQTRLMKSKLGIDTLQIRNVQAINLKYAKKMEPILKSSDSKITRIKLAMELQKAKDAELTAIFTPEQNKKYLAIESELMNKAKAMSQALN